MDIETEKLVELTRELALEGFEPHFGARAAEFPSSTLWRKVNEFGSELWLDTGDIAAAEKLWTQEFRALTTNNTLLNKEVQKGTYDELVPRAAARLLDAFPSMDSTTLVREIAFVLNARHGLRLVEKFDAFVSVEEHTDLADDTAGAVAYARRYHAICPQRFIVKIPLTAAGLLAARQVGREGVPVNLTLGFSARQNVLVAVIAQPRYCNVFLGRLNQVVADNDLGDGKDVGEKAVAASQHALNPICRSQGLRTRQIAASLRSGQQVRDLAGIDVLTIPPSAAAEFAGSADPSSMERGADQRFEPRWAEGIRLGEWGLDSLWDVPDGLAETAAETASMEPADPSRLLEALSGAGLSSIMPAWQAGQVEAASRDGKIPRLERWKSVLSSGEVGLDALMNLHGLRSFAADQKAMDDRILGLI